MLDQRAYRAFSPSRRDAGALWVFLGPGKLFLNMLARYGFLFEDFTKIFPADTSVALAPPCLPKSAA